jgi:hypothetical protein
VRYRQLALVEPDDPGKAALLRTIADEAESGVLCIAARISRLKPRPVPKVVS